MMRLPPCLAAGLSTLCALWPGVTAGVHHSHGNYGDNFIDLQGTVKEMHLLNPHSWIYLDVRSANSQLQKWDLEATNRIGLERIRRYR